WFIVFPWAEPLLPFDDVQVTQDGEPGGPAGPAGPGAGPGGEADLGEHDLPYDTSGNNRPPSPTRNR
ncbi:MAG TPA: hypothetical protein VF755_06385, partial [Catenuloplanes sp.]